MVRVAVAVIPRFSSTLWLPNATILIPATASPSSSSCSASTIPWTIIQNANAVTATSTKITTTTTATSTANKGLQRRRCGCLPIPYGGAQDILRTTIIHDDDDDHDDSDNDEEEKEERDTKHRNEEEDPTSADHTSDADHHENDLQEVDDGDDDDGNDKCYNNEDDVDNSEQETLDAYLLLAQAIQPYLMAKQDAPPSIKSGGEGSSNSINQYHSLYEERTYEAFQSLAAAQQTFKGLDGAAHELYQRTHTSSSSVSSSSSSLLPDLSVTGRTRRNAARLGATADGLAACECCEFGLEYPSQSPELQLHSTSMPWSNVDNNSAVPIGTGNATTNTTKEVYDSFYTGKELVYNGTIERKGHIRLNVVVFYEASYLGGAGVDHGGLREDTNDLLPSSKRATGRLLVILVESPILDLNQTLYVLYQRPVHVRIHQGLVSTEICSVQPILYQMAGTILKSLEPTLRAYSNSTAIHFTGHSLAGGVATLAATILQGSLALPGGKSKKSKRRIKSKSSIRDVVASASGVDSASSSTDKQSNVTIGESQSPLQGFGKDRTSVVTLGAPPCLSANVETNFVTSIVYGDDIVFRASKESLDRLMDRTIRAMKWTGLLGRSMNWMQDTLSLATANIKSHAIGSEGEELRLSIPGRAFLVRPRRLGGAYSMHEVGSQLKGGREALRAVFLWQLNDILLSKSLWKHHQLDSYIHGLDRVVHRAIKDLGSNGANKGDDSDE